MDNEIIQEHMLRLFTEKVFLEMGCSKTHAELASDVLIQADLRGVDSHGVARLVGYVRLWENGRINTQPHIKIIHETPSTAVVDGDAGLGLVVAPIAMEWALEKAEKVGTGWIAIKNSNHFGIAAYHAMKALGRDMMGWAMTNASALVAPTFSKQRMLGTNPIAFAAPAGEEEDFVLDMATTTAANGKLEIASRQNRPIPEGWAISKEGVSSLSANILKEGGMLLPLGSDLAHGSHKGYGLGAMVDILSGVLSGAAFSKWVPPFPAYVPLPTNAPGEGLGHFLGAMRVDAFQKAETFKSQMDIWMKSMKDAARIDEQQSVLIHGELERMSTVLRKKEGIPVHISVWNQLIELDQKFKINILQDA